MTETTAMDEPIQLFSKDDAGYRAWLAAHRQGYVLSIPKSYYGPLRLHHVRCSAIGQPSPLLRHTLHARKVCSDDLAALVDWAAHHGHPVSPCRLCDPPMDVSPPRSAADATPC
jgi:hypothetical protein